MGYPRACEFAAVVLVSAPLLQGLMKQGPPPLRQFHVRDYGARPDPGIDSGPGIRAAIAAAIGSGEPAEVLLGEGVYRVGRGPDEAYALSVVAARDLSVRGQDPSTEIIITDPELGGFRLSGCENVTVGGLVLDYDPPPYSQGTVAAVDLGNQTFDLAPDAGFLAPDHEAFANAKATWGLVIRPGADGAPTHYGPTAIPTIVERRMDQNRWRMSVGGPPTGYPDPLRTSGMAPGDRFVHAARNYAAAVGADHCDDLRLEGITLYASPGLAFLPYLCGKVSIRDCHIKPRPGSSRLLSTNADGVHCRGARQGITIEGCSFEGMSDDAINIHSSPIPVLEVLSPTELIVQRYHYTLRVGDRVEVMDSDEARARGQGTVVAVDEVPDRWAYRVRLDQPVQGVRGGTGFENADSLYNLSECATGSVVSHCHFGSFRGRGVLLSCVGATVSGNTFDVTEGWGVVLYHESTRWGEGPLARDIRIVGNTFNGHGGYQAAILAYPTRRDGQLAQAREMRNLLIQGNRFNELGVPAVDLHSCRDVRVLDNVVNTSAEAHRPRPTYASVTLDNCAGVKVAGLTVQDEDPRHVAAVLISPTAAGGTEGVEITDLSADLAPTSVPIRDERAPAP